MTTRGDVIVRNASNVTARLAKGSAGTYLGSDGTDVAYAAVTDAQLSTSDITTNNASTTKHGFAPKYPNDATKYLDGTGAYTVPAGGGGGGGGLSAVLEQHTASTSPQLDFTAFISSTYDVYLFELVDVVPDTDNVNCLLRMGTGGGPTYDSTAGHYGWTGIRSTNGAASGAGGAGGAATSIQLDVGDTLDILGGISGFFKLYNPQGTTAHQHRVVGEMSYWGNSGPQLFGATLFGTFDPTTAITALRFAFSSGNIASGTIRAYGFAK
jgi:hypothetical protein